MAAELFYLPFPTAFNSDGLPVGGAKLYFYLTGTTTPQPIYTTSGLTTQHTNPVIANSIGHFAPIYLDSSITYRLVIKDDDDVLLDEIDPYIPGVTSATFTAATGSAVSTRNALSNITGPVGGQIAFLTEAGRAGMFVFNAANLSTNVTNDPGQGVYVAPSSATSGASGAWVRVCTYLVPEWFGAAASGSTDDTTALRRCFNVACLLDLPVYASGRYYLNGVLYPGSLTNLAPAANTADGFTLIGAPMCTFIVKAGLASALAHIRVETGTDIHIENISWDIETEATEGGGQIRLTNVDRFTVRNIRKIASVVPSVTGGSAVSLQLGCSNFLIEEVIVRNAGASSAGVFCIGAENGIIRDIECLGGQEALDLSGCTNVTVEVLRAYETDEIVDVGNTINCTFRDLKGYNGVNGITCKTEITAGVADRGTNDNVFEDIHVEGFSGVGIRYSGGATTTQTLHRNKFKNVRLQTTNDTAASFGFAPLSGDVLADPTTGAVLENATIKMSAGTGIRLNGIINSTFRDVTIDAPTAVSDGSSSAFKRNTNNRWEGLTIRRGTFTTIHCGVHIDVAESIGAMSFIESRGTRLNRVITKNTDGYGIDFQFGDPKVANKDVRITNCESWNNSRAAGTHYGLGIRYSGASGPVQGVHVHNFNVEDDQRSLAFTSGGTAEPQIGDLLTGATSGATGRISAITLSSGSWAAGDAAGTFTIIDTGNASADFSAAENLNLSGSQTFANVATASGASTAAATSGGYQLANATFDHCTFSECRSKGQATSLSYGFTGLNSVNKDNNVRQGVETISSNATLTMLHANRVLNVTAAATLTIPLDAATVFPVGTTFKAVNASGGAVAFAHAGTVRSAGGLLGIAANGTVIAEKLSADVWTLVGDLA